MPYVPWERYERIKDSTFAKESSEESAIATEPDGAATKQKDFRQKNWRKKNGAKIRSSSDIQLSAQTTLFIFLSPIFLSKVFAKLTDFHSYYPTSSTKFASNCKPTLWLFSG